MKRSLLVTSLALCFAGSIHAQDGTAKQQLVPTDNVDYSHQTIKAAHNASKDVSFVMTRESTASSVADAEANGIATIDVAVYYSPLYRDYMTRSQVVARIEEYFEQVNANALESKAYIRFNPVFVREINEDFSRFCGNVNFSPSCTADEVEKFNLKTYYPLGRSGWINALMSNIDAWENLPEIADYAEASEQYGADLHVWFQPATDKELREGPLGVGSYLGQSALMADTPLASMDSFSEEFRPDPQELKDVQMANTLMHELGHNLGLSHEIEDYDDPTSFGGEPDQFAWTCGVGMRPGNAQTAMWAYTDLLRPAYPLYSNPDIIRNERVCGDNAVANQARVLNEYGPTAAAMAERPAVVGTVSFSQAEYTAAAGQDAILIEVTRTGDINTDAEVAVLTKNGGAIEGEDYTVDTRLVKFQPGQSTNTARIELSNTDGKAKTFDVVLKHPLALDITGNDRALVKMDGTGSAFSGTVSVSTDQLSFGETQTHTVTLTRDNNLDSELVVTVQTQGGNAVPNVNYQPIDTNIHFLPGESEASFDVTSGSATEVKTFNIALSSPMSATFSADTISATVNPGNPGYIVFDKTVGEIYFSRDEDFTEVCEDQKNANPETHFVNDEYCHYLRVYGKDSQTLTMNLRRKGGTSGTITNTVALATLKEILEQNRFISIEWDSKLSQYYEAIGEDRPSDDTTADVEQYYIEPEFYNTQKQTVTFEDGQETATVTFIVKEIPNVDYIDAHGYNTLAYLETPEGNDAFYYTEPGGMLATVEDWSPQTDNGGSGDGGSDNGGSTGGDTGSTGGSTSGSGNDSSASSNTQGAASGWLFLLLTLPLAYRRKK
ncbi:hypothetical protein CWI84_02960 [Idiomarina tyrosinivorans]|uniref:Calx-beta domain-containing protein n=1 Tax=Idiomarina tyrosinivorans TaxID=1445662 RepID=A0A432ZTH1_9GAMM|nr:Calx-beta domain-containing protein [Idiomarina tyrosinivorans]RUO81086.1 hypothetical protein CWI84_02960 [Idiomarina tyrosinivorans]